MRPDIFSSILLEQLPLHGERDRAVVEELLDDVAASRGHSLWIEGGPGIGKTLTARRIDVAARRMGFRCLYGHGVLRSASEGDSLALRLLATSVPGLRSAREAESVLARLVSSQLTLIVVDDVQWADGGSLYALAALAARMHRLPIGMVFAAGIGERPADPAALATLSGDPDAVRLLLRPLDGAAVERLTAELLDAPDSQFVTTLLKVSGGVPLFVKELLWAGQFAGWRPTRAYVDEVTRHSSAAIADTIVDRIERNDSTDAALRLAHAIAVLGAAETPLAAAVARVDPPTTVDATEVLQRLLIVEGDEPLRFAQPVVGSSLYLGMDVARRQDAHRRAAWHVFHGGGPDDTAARHLLHAPPRGERWAVEVLQRAARAPGHQTAEHDTDVAYLQRALAECPRPAASTLPVDVARALLQTRPAEAIARLERLYGQAT